jgi:2-methylcitrate dehydratase PrpD
MKGAEQLKTAHNLRVEEIDRIHVEAPHETLRLGTRLPATTEESQFNLAWPLAALLVDGIVGPAQILEHRFADPRIRDLAQRINVVETVELNELYGLVTTGDPKGKYASKVTITLKDGRAFQSGVVEGNINFPQQDWDEERLEGKFRWLAGQVLNDASVDELADMIWNFDQVTAVDELTRLLA